MILQINIHPALQYIVSPYRWFYKAIYIHPYNTFNSSSTILVSIQCDLYCPYTPNLVSPVTILHFLPIHVSLSELCATFFFFSPSSVFTSAPPLPSSHFSTFNSFQATDHIPSYPYLHTLPGRAGHSIPTHPLQISLSSSPLIVKVLRKPWLWLDIKVL